MKTLFIFCLALVSCTISKNITTQNYHLLSVPPNGIRINENLFCDKSEISNFDWLEYMYWKKMIYGFQSEQYRSSLPDTTVWLKEESCLHDLSRIYLRHPAYRDHPVVGISQSQALAYSKWRSDRVMEVMLIKMNLLEYGDTSQTPEMHFTIERYFNGSFIYSKTKETIKPDPRIKYYPKFRLPTLMERKSILSYSRTIR